MRFYRLTECADANIKACGLWVHVGVTLVGIAPNWWRKDRYNKRPVRRLGIEIATPARHYDRYIVAALTVGRKHFGVFRLDAGRRWRIGEVPV